MAFQILIAHGEHLMLHEQWIDDEASGSRIDQSVQANELITA